MISQVIQSYPEPFDRFEISQNPFAGIGLRRSYIETPIEQPLHMIAFMEPHSSLVLHLHPKMSSHIDCAFSMELSFDWFFPLIKRLEKVCRHHQNYSFKTIFSTSQHHHQISSSYKIPFVMKHIYVLLRIIEWNWDILSFCRVLHDIIHLRLDFTVTIWEIESTQVWSMIVTFHATFSHHLTISWKRKPNAIHWIFFSLWKKLRIDWIMVIWNSSFKL